MKLEHMTELHRSQLVPKNHPRIALRGAIDSLLAQLLLTMSEVDGAEKAPLLADLASIQAFLSHLQYAEAADVPLETITMLGLSDEMLREHSHNPSRIYGVPHLFALKHTAGRDVLLVNLLRAQSRSAERLAVDAFYNAKECAREDILKGLNRLSSAFYVIELRITSKYYEKMESVHTV